jgi:hypothetical protein
MKDDFFILEHTLEEMKDPNIKEILITEALEKIKLPRKFRSPAIRRKVLQQCGESAFIDPDNMKYPTVNPDTCKTDCKVLLASYYGLKKLAGVKVGASDMYHKAKDLLHENNCSTKIGVHIEGIEEIMELDTVLSMLD